VTNEFGNGPSPESPREHLRLRHQPGELDEGPIRAARTSRNLPDELPLKVRRHPGKNPAPEGDRVFTWHLAIAMRPRLWMFNISVGRLGHDRDGGMGGPHHGPIPVSPDRARRSRCSPRTIEAYKHAPLPDALFQQVNPAKIDAYHTAIA